MTIRSIVVPTDFSDLSQVAFPHARELAREWGAGIVLVHVVPPAIYPGIQGPYLTSFPEFHEQLRGAVLSRLETLLPQFGEDVRVTLECRDGTTVEEIEAVATEHGAGLIVIATHGSGGLQHAVIGSEVERLVRTSPVPVFTVSARDAREPVGASGLHRIVVPTDFSTNAVRAFDLALEFANPETEIKLVHVFEPPVFAVGPLGFSSFDFGRLESEQRQHAGEVMDRLVEDLRTRHSNTHGLVIAGVPAPQILRLSEEEGVGAIAIATHGYSGFKRFSVGSVAEKVLRRANCPIIITQPGKPIYEA